MGVLLICFPLLRCGMFCRGNFSVEFCRGRLFYFLFSSPRRPAFVFLSPRFWPVFCSCSSSVVSRTEIGSSMISRIAHPVVIFPSVRVQVSGVAPLVYSFCWCFPDVGLNVNLRSEAAFIQAQTASVCTLFLQRWTCPPALCFCCLVKALLNLAAAPNTTVFCSFCSCWRQPDAG